MSIISPAILAKDTHVYREEMERVQPFAERIQIDFMDKEFTGVESIKLEQAWWPDTVKVDLHVMFADPSKQIETLIAMRPHMIIIHAEASGNVAKVITDIKDFKIKTGIAILPETDISVVSELIATVDHVLIFAGRLGHHGGKADLKQLEKIVQIKLYNPKVEIGWDGGINAENAKQIAAHGVDVLNVGGYIQHAEDPAQHYQQLSELVTSY